MEGRPPVDEDRPEPADPADREAHDAYVQAVAVMYAQNSRPPPQEHSLLPKEWRDASTFSDYGVRVTAKHAEQLTERMHDLFMELQEDAEDDPDAADFVFQFQAFPRPGLPRRVRSR